MLTEYIRAAMRHAHYEFLENDKEFYGNIELLPGVWATGGTLEACRDELKEVLQDWLMIGLRRNISFPEIDGISLAPQTAQNA
jgi:predicted RNase H-like HicB family nuclease